MKMIGSAQWRVAKRDGYWYTSGTYGSSHGPIIYCGRFDTWEAAIRCAVRNAQGYSD